MVDLQTEVPRIKTVKELKEYINPSYVIDKYVESPKEYMSFIDRIRNIMRGCIDIEECRTYPIKFKFFKDEKDTHVLPLRSFL